MIFSIKFLIDLFNKYVIIETSINYMELVLMKNKNTFILSMGIACAVCVGFGIAYSVRHQKIKQFKKNVGELPMNFTCTAHTGCMGTVDNSIESIEQAVASGAEIVEFDLNFTKSGEPVLAHDSPVGGEVTLDEAFKKISEYDSIKVNVDIKSTDNLPIVKTLAEKYNLSDRIFFTGVNDGFLDAVRTYGNNVPYYLNVDVKPIKEHNTVYLQMLVDKVKQSGAIGINFNKCNATADFVNAFHSNGLLVSIWTVDDKSNMYRIISFKPDNITTRKPDKLKKIIDEL